MSINLNRVKLTATAMITAVTGATALWAPSQYPRSSTSPAQVVTAKITRGPTVGRTQVRYESEPTSLRWTAVAPALGQRLILGVSGARWAYDVQGGDDVTDARDGLLAQIVASSVNGHQALPGVAVTADGAASILLNASGVPGLLWSPGIRGGEATLTVVSEVDCETETGIADCVLEFQAYVRGPGATAHELLGALGGALRGHDVAAIRERWGVAFRGSLTEPINLDALAGAGWESRAAARLPIAVRSYRAVAVATIETTQLSLTVEDAVLEFEVSAP